MKSPALKAFDLDHEDKALARYGETEFGRGALLANRLTKTGVRFVKLNRGGFDNHSNIFQAMRGHGAVMDPALAALIGDLATDGRHEKTLVMVLSEFGRTPLGQGNDGRDHHPNAFSVWMAGGGVKGGTVYGTTDELGWAPAENPVHVNDFQATLLRLFGLDHERLTVNHRGLGVRLTNLGGNVIEDVIA